MSLATTPFGRRPLSLAQIAARALAAERPRAAKAHKWTIFRALCCARERLALSERALAVLDALLSFHPETVLSGDDLVVFPSNAHLSLRAHGMAASTLRRHLGALVEAGIVLRRDSPNGKRYARRGRDGAISTAFGFDLSPLVARAQEFEALADEVRAEREAFCCARERVTLARRDLAKMIAAGQEQGVALPAEADLGANWGAVQCRYRALVEVLPRAPSLREIETAAHELGAFATAVLNLLQLHANTKNSSANESQFERHKQNSNTESHPDLEPANEKGEEEAPSRPSEAALPLPLVLQACPDIADYARGGVADWRDLLAAAAVARAALGVSPSAWGAAQAAMGERPAAIVIAAILQRGAAISSPGGYLRELTRKAQANAFSLGPMLWALIGARNREKKCA